MAEFVEICGVNFLAVDFLAGVSEVPEVIQVENDLGRDRGRAVFFLAKRRSGEQPERIRLDPVGYEFGTWGAFESDRQARGAVPQGRGQRRQRGGHFSGRQVFELVPIWFHAGGDRSATQINADGRGTAQAD